MGYSREALLFILYCIPGTVYVWGIVGRLYYLPRRRRPGTGDIATPPVRLSVRPSVCPSRLVFALTQKRIDVFSRNFAGTCTMSWGCAV